MSRCILAVAVMLAVGCGGTIKGSDDDGTTDGSVDVTTESNTDVEAEPSEDPVEDVVGDPVEDVVDDPVPDGPDPGCDTDLGTFTPPDIWAGATRGPTSDYWGVYALLSGDWWPPPINELLVESWVSYGGPTSPGTYTITSWEDYETCTMCVWVWEDCTDYGSGCAHYYMAERATVEFTTLEPRVGGDVEGSLSDAYLIEVTEDGLTRVEDGLSFCVDLWTFSETFESFG